MKTDSPKQVPKDLVKQEEETPKKESKELFQEKDSPKKEVKELLKEKDSPKKEAKELLKEKDSPKKEAKVTSPVHKQEEAAKAKTSSTFSLKSASAGTQNKDSPPLSPESGKLYGGVVLRKRTDKHDTDITKRQTVAMGTGVSSVYEDKSQDTPIPPRNWDDLDKPKPKVEESDQSNEFANVFNKLTRKSSQKRVQLEKEDRPEIKNSHNTVGNRASVASIDVKIGSDSSSSSNNARLKPVEIDIVETKDTATEPVKKDNKVGANVADVKKSVTKNVVDTEESSQDTKHKDTSNVVMRDPDKSKSIKENRSSVRSIDVKIDKTSTAKVSEVKQDTAGKSYEKKDKVEEKKEIVTPSKGEEKVLVTKPSDLPLKAAPEDKDYQKSSPTTKDRFRSQTMPDSTEVSKVAEQASPSLQRSKTSVDRGSVVQGGITKSEPKKIFKRTMEDGSLPPWFKTDKDSTAKVPLPSPTKEPAR